MVITVREFIILIILTTRANCTHYIIIFGHCSSSFPDKPSKSWWPLASRRPFHLPFGSLNLPSCWSWSLSWYYLYLFRELYINSIFSWFHVSILLNSISKATIGGYILLLLISSGSKEISFCFIFFSVLSFV